MKSRLGQNFLTDKSIVADLIKAADVTGSDVLLEIGSGSGFVTEEIIKVAKKVYSVEIDQILIPKLLEKFKSEIKNGKLEVIHNDILKILENNSWTTSRNVTNIIGSIPYQITSPLIHLLINNENLPATILMQKEVAERLTAKTPHATYLSNYVANWGLAQVVQVVSKKVFDPVPEVDGAIVTLVPHSSPSIDTIKFSKFLHLGFSNPRKMLNKVFDKETLLKLNIDHTRRAETLSLDEWYKLYKIM